MSEISVSQRFFFQFFFTLEKSHSTPPIKNNNFNLVKSYYKADFLSFKCTYNWYLGKILDMSLHTLYYLTVHECKKTALEYFYSTHKYWTLFLILVDHPTDLLLLRPRIIGGLMEPKKTDRCLRYLLSPRLPLLFPACSSAPHKKVPFALLRVKLSFISLLANDLLWQYFFLMSNWNPLCFRVTQWPWRKKGKWYQAGVKDF